jgi:mercuric ion transport protein
MTKNRKLLWTGTGGTIVAALCCFTPILVILLGAVGLSAWLGWIDYVLFPALGFFLLLTTYALYRQRKYPDAARVTAPDEPGVNP